MRRWLFNLATAVSLVLCVAVGVLWVRSAWHYDVAGMNYVRWPQRNEMKRFSLQAESYWGTFRFSIVRDDYDPSFFRDIGAEVYRATFGPGLHCDLVPDAAFLSWYFVPAPGFTHEHEVKPASFGQRSETWAFGVRDWLPMLVLLILPTLWAYRLATGGRIHRRGLCPTCGYDLRATPDRCPECGAVPPVPQVPPVPPVPQTRGQRTETRDQTAETVSPH